MVRSRCLTKPSSGQDRRKRITVPCRDAGPGSKAVTVVHLPPAGSALQGDRTVSGATLIPRARAPPAPAPASRPASARRCRAIATWTIGNRLTSKHPPNDWMPLLDKDDLFARFTGDQTPSANKREQVTIQRLGHAEGSRVVEVAHIRSAFSTGKSTPTRANAGVRAASWEDSFWAKPLMRAPVSWKHTGRTRSTCRVRHASLRADTVY
jgi:hypothetical protein